MPARERNSPSPGPEMERELPSFRGLPLEYSPRMSPEDAIFRRGLLQDKRILITGGGTGLGRAMAERFLRLGAAVHICGRRQEVLEAAAQELGALGPVRAWSCDVREAESVEKMVAGIWSEAPLDVVVNNAAGNFLA